MDYITKIRQKVGHDPIFMPAACGIFYRDGKIGLQRRADNRKWGTSGGGMELGETPEQTLARELHEELNVQPTKISFFSISAGEDAQHFVYPNGDEVYGVAIMYLIEDYSGTITPNPEEVLDFAWFDPSELPPRAELNPPDYHTILRAVDHITKNY